jgi:hypothetical protein
MAYEDATKVNSGSTNKVIHDVSQKTAVNRLVGWTIGWAIIFAAIGVVNYYDRHYLTNGFLTSPYIVMLVYVVCSGGIGGILYSLNYIVAHLEKGDFGPQYYLSYYLRPIISALVGAVSFLVIAGGLMNLTGVGTNADYTNFSTILTFCGIALLSGFATDKFLDKLGDLANTLFTSSSKNSDQNQDNSSDQKSN